MAVLVFACVIATGISARTAMPALAAPSQLPPEVHIKTLGQLGSATVPLQVTWPAAQRDGPRIGRYELQLSRDNGPWGDVNLPSRRARSVTVNQRAWSVLRFRVRAVDRAAVASDWAYSAPVWMEVAQENDSALDLSPGWQIVRRSSAFGHHRAVTTQGGERASFTFTGNEVGWVARLGPAEGTVRVMIDGRDPALLDLHRSSGSSRRLVFTAQLPTPGTHTITITTESSGATVDVDAFVVLADPTDATLVGAGDIATCSSAADTGTAAVAASVPGIVFTAGDNVYPDGAATNYTDCYDPTWGALIGRTRPALGNHDYENTPGATGYFDYFGASAGDPATGWYEYDAGTWRVYVLNSECGSSCAQQQYDWLKASLSAEPHLCTLAIWHRPRFSTGPHGNSTRMDAIWQLLAANRADVVLNGHDHMYERYTPLDANGAADEAGIREFVVGTGGASLYAFKTSSPLIEVRDDTTHGVLRLDLGQGSYGWQFLPAGSGTFTDSGSGNCH